MRLRGTWLLLGAGLLALTAGCGDDSDGDEPTTTTSSTITTSSSTTLQDGTSTTDDPEVDTSIYQPIPGTACDLGSDPDCIDPEGDGSGTYLTGGGECMKANKANPAMCSDLDEDGVAGYPDSG